LAYPIRHGSRLQIGEAEPLSGTGAVSLPVATAVPEPVEPSGVNGYLLTLASAGAHFFVEDRGREERAMKAMAVAGVLLVVLGALMLAYQGFTYTSRKKIIDIGPVQATKTEHKNIDLPPVLGTGVLVGGIALLAVAARKR
jgi:hypothetical protein